MTNDQALSLARSIAKIAGGILAAHGMTAASTALTTGPVIEMIAGIITAGISLYLSHCNHSPVLSTHSDIQSATQIQSQPMPSGQFNCPPKNSVTDLTTTPPSNPTK
jgi:hypothetical protein